jgi:hypothetical protein
LEAIKAQRGGLVVERFDLDFVVESFSYERTDAVASSMHSFGGVQLDSQGSSFRIARAAFKHSLDSNNLDSGVDFLRLSTVTVCSILSSKVEIFKLWSSDGLQSPSLVSAADLSSSYCLLSEKSISFSIF